MESNNMLGDADTSNSSLAYLPACLKTHGPICNSKCWGGTIGENKKRKKGDNKIEVEGFT